MCRGHVESGSWGSRSSRCRSGGVSSLRSGCPGLENDIRDWIATWNENPRPFTWTKTADEILASLAGYLAKVGTGHRIDEQD